MSLLQFRENFPDLKVQGEYQNHVYITVELRGDQGLLQIPGTGVAWL